MSPVHVTPVSPDEEILTERCRLRFPDEADIPHIWSASRTPNFNDGLSWEPPSSMDEILAPLREAQASWRSGHDYNWSIELRGSGDFVGWMAIHRGDDDGHWSVGFWIHPRRQGKGLAAECAKAMLDFGFSRLGASVITACHATWNTASGKVLRRVGMRYFRNNPKGFRKSGEWIEVMEYEIRSD